MIKTKISKTVTLDYESFDVVRQLMEKSKRNFSQTMDLIVQQWIRFQRELKKEQAYISLQEKQKERDIQMEVHNRLEQKETKK